MDEFEEITYLIMELMDLEKRIPEIKKRLKELSKQGNINIDLDKYKFS